MPLTRLLAVALLLFPLTAIGQNKQNDGPPAKQPATSAAPSSEPWRILPNDTSKPGSPKDSLTQLLNSEDPGIRLMGPAVSATDHLAVLAKRQLASPGFELLGTTCFAIRSYVVARDRKDSDSTHLVHYSTCQPAGRYSVKTIQLQAGSPSH